MNLFQKFFGAVRHTFQRWREIGTYRATFSGFTGDIYRSEIIRSCIRPLAEFSSKATARCGDKQLERLLNNRPNMYMSGRDFVYKVRTQVELKNTAFILIERSGARVTSVYPIPYQSFELLEYANGLFVRFSFAGTSEKMTVAWENLAVIRKDYCDGDVAGESNDPIRNTLDMIMTSNEGLSNAVRATANLRGILKSTKTMLSPEDVKAQKDQFVKDYMTLENQGGIASLDGTQEFTPITMNPVITSYEQMKEFRENVYRYFGVNDKVVMSDMTADELEAFYEMRIMPFLAALSEELTSKIYSIRELAFSTNYVTYSESKLQFATLSKKVDLFSKVVLYGGMTVNEWRAACDMDPIEGGDTRIMRLDAGAVDESGDAIKEDEQDGTEGA